MVNLMVTKRVKQPMRGWWGMVQRIARNDDVNYKRIQGALMDHDATVSSYEVRWGVDRLQELVSFELREKFYQQRDRLNKAIDSNDGMEVVRQVEVTSRAYAKLEQEAIARGHSEVTGDYFEAAMADGKVLAVCKTKADCVKVARDNREMVVYSVDEIAHLLSVQSKPVVDKVNEVKSIFPGAEIVSIKPIDEPLDDEIPF